MFIGLGELTYDKVVLRHVTQTEKKILQINVIGFKIPTGGMLTCWLFKSMTEELNMFLFPH